MAHILLIPGLLCDRVVWQPLIDRLGDKSSVADLSTQDSLIDMARDCLAQNPGTNRVAGHSMGGRVALEMAHQAPERIERLALLDTGFHPLREGETAKRDEIVHFAYEYGMSALAERWLPGMVSEQNRADRGLMQRLTDMVLRGNPDLHARQIKALVKRPDAGAYISQITCPVLLLVGRQDQWSPVSQHEDMLALLPGAHLEIIDNAGHFAPLEQPEVVSRLLAEFLT